MAKQDAAEKSMEKQDAAEKSMAKQDAAEVTPVVAAAAEEAHPYAFHVSGPRNVCSPNWRDLISSSWKNGNYKRTVVACFIQAVYLLELDRQENRTNKDNALAPKWWIPFKYKLVQILTDERDGSIFGAILEWDRSAAMADLVLMRPSGAPRAVLALRGTLLKSQTFRRDIEDDLRFLAWESLKGSVRFDVALQALKTAAESYGSSNVCVAGHSLGAGFALQVGKALAKDGIYVETHLFNPPSVSVAMSLRNIGEKAEFAWKRIKSMIPSSGSETTTESNDNNIEEEKGASSGLKSWVTNNINGWMKNHGRWVPHLYVNNSDYICCSYTECEDKVEKSEDNSNEGKENMKVKTNGAAGGGGAAAAAASAAKLFVMSKGKQKFLEAHGLEQWWSDDLQLQVAVNESKLITRQLKSLYTLSTAQLKQPNPPST